MDDLDIVVFSIIAANVVMGVYLFVQFLSNLWHKRKFSPWVRWWLAGSFLFYAGVCGIFHGGIIILGGNIFLLAYTIHRQLRASSTA